MYYFVITLRFTGVWLIFIKSFILLEDSSIWQTGCPRPSARGLLRPQQQGMTKWVPLDSAKIYALPELLFSLYKFYPFLSAWLPKQPSDFRLQAGPETEMMSLLATCFQKAPNQLSDFRLQAGPETEMMSLLATCFQKAPNQLSDFRL